MNIEQLHFFNKIVAERKRQDELWGFPQKNTNAEWGCILAEECGEVAQEVLRIRFSDKSPEDLKTELVQVAAVCVSWLEHLENK